MIDSIRGMLALMLLIYAVIISVLYFNDLRQKDDYMKIKEESLKRKEEDLAKRESIIVDKEICFRELTKIKTIHTNVLDILKSYTVPTKIEGFENVSVQSPIAPLVTSVATPSVATDNASNQQSN